MNTYALDFETYYDKDYSVKDMGAVKYCADPRFDAYLIAVAGSDGYKFCGAPADADWSRLSGQRWLSHNVEFDKEVFLAWGKTDSRPAEWHDTADVARYRRSGSSLKDAAKGLLGIKADKTVRDKMKNVKFKDLSTATREEWIRYAQTDSDMCLQIWEQFGADMPPEELAVARLTHDWGRKGIRVDTEELARCIEVAETAVSDSIKRIPWASDGVVLSHPRLRRFCEENGIRPPTSMAEDSEECALWETEYGMRFPVIKDLRRYRKSNTLLKKLRTISDRTHGGSLAYSLKYFGACLTGRWSGAGGFNLQNLGREPWETIDLRRLLLPPEGKQWAIVDFAQIEPRVLNWLTGNTVMLDAMKAGFGIYEAFAIATGMWDKSKGSLKKNDPAKYLAAKAAVLGAGYGMGANKFMATAPLLTGGQYTPTAAESERVITEFRANNPAITGLWRRLERDCAFSSGGDFTVELPSGRAVVYEKVRKAAEGLVYKKERHADTRHKYWGGHGTENVIQAIARDVLRDALLAAAGQGLDVSFHVHDEIVAAVDGQEGLDALLAVMKTAPAWAEGLPVDAEGSLAPYYKK